MWRTAACLIAGALLWVGWGAVRGIAYWRVTAGNYVVVVAIAGAVLGLIWPADGHLRTGFLLVLPGLVALFTPDPGGHPDLLWWLLALLTAMGAAAGSHWAAAEVREWVHVRRF